MYFLFAMLVGPCTADKIHFCKSTSLNVKNCSVHIVNFDSVLIVGQYNLARCTFITGYTTIYINAA